MRNLITFTATALLAGLLAACAGVPQAELDEARAAREEAEAERAPILAPGDYEDAMKAWDEAQEHIEQESFRQAKTTLVTARSRFQKARDIAGSKREQMLSEAQGMQKTIEIRYGRLKESAASARLAAARKRDLEKAYADIDEGIGKLESMIEGGQYMDAKDHSVGVMRLVYEAEQLIR